MYGNEDIEQGRNRKKQLAVDGLESFFDNEWVCVERVWN